MLAEPEEDFGVLDHGNIDIKAFGRRITNTDIETVERFLSGGLLFKPESIERRAIIILVYIRNEPVSQFWQDM